MFLTIVSDFSYFSVLFIAIVSDVSYYSDVFTLLSDVSYNFK